jgi:MFS family permease
MHVAAPPASTPLPGDRLWTPNYALLLFSVHTHFASWFMLVATLPLYIEDRPDWQIGLVVGAIGASSVLVRPFTGRWVDRLGRRRFMIAGAAMVTASLLAYGLSGALAALVAVRLFHGIGMALFTTAGLAMAADIAPASRRGEAMGYFAMVNSASQIYAPALGFLIADRLGFGPMFVFGAASAALALAGSLALREPRREMRGSGDGGLFAMAALAPCLVFLSLTATVGGVQAFLPLMAVERGLGNPGLFFTLFGVALVLNRVYAGRIADVHGRGAVVIPGLALTSLAMVGLAFADARWLFLPIAVVFGTAFAMGHTGLLALVVDRSDPAERGAAMAMFALTWDVGAALGSVALGGVLDLTNFTTVYLLTASFTMAALALFVTRLPAGRAALPEAVVSTRGG